MVNGARRSKNGPAIGPWRRWPLTSKISHGGRSAKRTTGGGGGPGWPRAVAEVERTGDRRPVEVEVRDRVRASRSHPHRQFLDPRRSAVIDEKADESVKALLRVVHGYELQRLARCARGGRHGVSFRVAPAHRQPRWMAADAHIDGMRTAIGDADELGVASRRVDRTEVDGAAAVARAR